MELNNMRIKIKENKEAESDIADMLRHIANEIDRGMQRGFYPNWEIVKEDEEDYEMLSRENANMAKALSKLNYTPAQINDICNGAI